MSSERVDEGYLVIFDTKTLVGEECELERHDVEGKSVLSFVIAIGQRDKN